MAGEGDFATQILEFEKGLPTGDIMQAGPESLEQARKQLRAPKTFAEQILAFEAIKDSERQKEIDIAKSIDPTNFLKAQLEAQNIKSPRIDFEKEFTNYLDRIDFSLSDTKSEMKLKFMSKFPDGDFVFVQAPPKVTPEKIKTRTGILGNKITSKIPEKLEPAKEIILFRRHPNEPFARFDSEDFGLSQIILDTADFAGEIPAIGIELVVSRGAGLIRQALSAFGATVVGEAVKQSIDELRGLQEQTLKELMVPVGGKSSAAAAGTIVIGGPLGAVSNIFRGAGLADVSTPGQKALQTAKKIKDFPGFTVSQLSKSPMLQLIGAQSARVSKSIPNFVERQEISLVNALNRLSDKFQIKFLKSAEKDLQAMFDDAVDQYTGILQVSDLPLTGGGNGLQVATVEAEDLTQALVDRIYTNARRLGKPEHDISNLKGLAADMKAGKPGLSEGGGLINLEPLAPSVENIINDILALDTALPDTKVVTEFGERTVSGIDQLRALRTRLFNISLTPPGLVADPAERAAINQAKKLVAALNDVLDTPTRVINEAGEEVPPSVYAKRWKAANNSAKKRFRMLEKAIIREAARTETPAQFAKRLAQPDKVDEIRFVKNLLNRFDDTRGKWEIYRNSVVSDFISDRNLPNLSSRLSQFDKATREELFGKELFEKLVQVGRDVDRLNALNLDRVLQEQVQRAGVVEGLISTNNRAAIQDLASRINASPDRPASVMLRGGIIDNIVNKAKTRQKGLEVLDHRKITQEIERLKDSGAINILQESDVQALIDIRDVAELVSLERDVGASIQAAELGSGLLNFRASAAYQVARLYGVGKLFTENTGRKIILGIGNAKKEANILRLLGSAITRASSSVEESLLEIQRDEERLQREQSDRSLQ